MLDALKAIIRTLYIIALMGFTLWYGYFLYPVIFGTTEVETEEDFASQEIEAFFGEGTTEEEKEFMKSLKQQQRISTTDLGYMVIEEQYVKGHFHHVGMKVETDDNSICTRCHGAVPHDKAKTIRAFLNMHAFYMACETCHVRPEDDEQEWEFRWYDKATGKVVANPPGLNTLDESMYGNYSAKISPGGIKQDGSFKFINGPKELAFVERYLKEEGRLDDTQKSKMKKVIHRNVNEDPLICDGCHTISDEPYLPFTLLGYPQRRLHELTSTEVVGMINKYQEFYIPNLLRGGGVDKDVETE
ncbi:MAG: cytochrome C [Candidatus Thiodiazotropha sp. (ex Epidulcina cf. delphinae)]|nr:cytochrome C [Candidatus Thiodiazotropha sp. (ex Epidulcina cf. delphinae)]